jgi:hypothetical protein
MKRYDTVYFLYESAAGRTIVKKGVIASVNPDTVVITPSTGRSVIIIPKDRVSLHKDKLKPSV